MLNTPVVVGPISELASRVWISGVVSGALVEVISSPSMTVVARDVTRNASAHLLLTSPLVPGEVLFAKQTLGSLVSPDPDPVLGQMVLPQPARVNQLSELGFDSALYGCGKYVQVSGAFYNAAIEFTSNGGTPVVVDEAEFGAAMVTISAGLVAAGTASARQRVASLGAGPSLSVAVQNVIERLPPPVVSPVMECDTAVTVSNLYDGNDVELGVSERSLARRSTVSSSTTISVRPMKAGAKVSATQASNCGRSATGPEVQVQPTALLPAPVVVGQLWEGSGTANLEGMRPGAMVEVDVNGDSYLAQANESGAVQLNMRPLSASTGNPPGILKARQRHCGKVSADALVAIERPPTLQKPALAEPLVEGARAVWVFGVPPGSWLHIVSDQYKGPVSASIYFASPSDNSSRVIAVAPFLLAGDSIRAVVRRGALRQESDSVLVQTRESVPLPAPRISNDVVGGIQAVQIDTAVAGQKMIPGSWCEVFEAPGTSLPPVPARRLGADVYPNVVGLSRPLVVGERIFGRVTLGSISKNTPPRDVLRPRPLPPRDQYPGNGDVNVSTEALSISWFDLGIGDGKADEFDVWIAEPGSPPAFSHIYYRTVPLPVTGSDVLWVAVPKGLIKPSVTYDLVLRARQVGPYSNVSSDTLIKFTTAATAATPAPGTVYATLTFRASMDVTGGGTAATGAPYSGGKLTSATYEILKPGHPVIGVSGRPGTDVQASVPAQMATLNIHAELEFNYVDGSGEKQTGVAEKTFDLAWAGSAQLVVLNVKLQGGAWVLE